MTTPSENQPHTPDHDRTGSYVDDAFTMRRPIKRALRPSLAGELITTVLAGIGFVPETGIVVILAAPGTKWVLLR